MSSGDKSGKAPASPSGSASSSRSGSASGRSSPAPAPAAGNALDDAVARRQQSVAARAQHASGAGSALDSAVAGRADQQARRASLVPPLDLGGGGGAAAAAAAAPESPRVYRTMDPGTPRADGRGHLPSKAETGAGAGAREYDHFETGGGQSAGPVLAAEARRAQNTTGGAVFSASIRDMGERGIAAVNDKPGHFSIRAAGAGPREEHNAVFQANRDMWRQETPAFPKPPKEKKKKKKKSSGGGGAPKGSGAPPGKPPGGGRGGRGGRGGGGGGSSAAVPVK